MCSLIRIIAELIPIITCVVKQFKGMLFFYSRVMRKQAFCIYENKEADQLLSNCASDQRLCFRYKSVIPLLPKSEISSV